MDAVHLKMRILHFLCLPIGMWFLKLAGHQNHLGKNIKTPITQATCQNSSIRISSGKTTNSIFLEVLQVLQYAVRLENCCPRVLSASLPPAGLCVCSSSLSIIVPRKHIHCPCL